MEEIFEIVMLLIKQHLPKIKSSEDFDKFYEQVRVNGELTQEEIDGFFFSSEYLYSVVKKDPDITKDEYDNGYITWVKNNVNDND